MTSRNASVQPGPIGDLIVNDVWVIHIDVAGIFMPWRVTTGVQLAVSHVPDTVIVPPPDVGPAVSGLTMYWARTSTVEGLTMNQNANKINV